MPDPKQTSQNGKKVEPKPISKKPDLSTVKSILSKGKYGAPLVGGFMAGRDLISRISLDRMAKNLNPYDYATGKSVIDRVVQTVFKNKKEEERALTEQYIDKGYGQRPDPQFKPRVDLLQMLAGKPQKYNTIKPSEYRPTYESDKNTQYYSSKDLENEIITALGLNEKNINLEKDILDITRENAILNKKGEKMKGEKGGYVAIVPGLGGATYGVGRDKKGIYLSYSDLWDLDPSKGTFAEEDNAYNPTTLENLKNIAVGAAKSFGTYVVNAEATPANVYGRIYFDPKTGKPIRRQ
jgi:hypothetical protein